MRHFSAAGRCELCSPALALLVIRTAVTDSYKLGLHLDISVLPSIASLVIRTADTDRYKLGLHLDIFVLPSIASLVIRTAVTATSLGCILLIFILSSGSQQGCRRKETNTDPGSSRLGGEEASNEAALNLEAGFTL